MATALDARSDELDEGEHSFVAQIRSQGWFRTHVLGDAEGPGFSFTTGFWVSAKQPELIIFSTKEDIAHAVFWDLFRDAKGGKRLPIGERTDAVFGNLPAFVFRVAKKHHRDLLGWSRWFYGGDDFPCLQIVWPDKQGRFPWEPEFDDHFAGEQPHLTDRGWINEIKS